MKMCNINNMFLLLIFSFSLILAENEASGLSYINELRQKANMITFTRNSILDKASIDHSNYLKANNTGGHIERKGAPAFTGVTPDDRAIYSGFFSKSIGENVSVGHPTIYSSIDGLMTAIYHRIGFLSFDFNVLGLSKIDTYYTYVMGNSGLNYLCENEESERRGKLICKGDKAFSDKTIDDIKEGTSSDNPKFVIWPPDNSDKNPPYFYEESPDPLPNYDVSGNPIHIRFNSFYYKPPFTLNKFRVLDDKGNEIDAISRSKANEINSGFLDDSTFILFPKERLKWNAKYNVEYDFTTSSGEKVSGTSSFNTTDLGEKVYSINGDAKTNLKIKANTDYIIDVLPLNPRDEIMSKGYSSGGTATKNLIEIISGNTLKVNFSGSNGQFFTLFFSNKSREVTLTIADEDDIKAEQGDDQNNGDDGNNGETMTMNYGKGWNLASIPGKTKITNLKQYFKDFIVVYTYNGSSFTLNPSTINYDQAYLVYFNKQTTIQVELGEEYQIEANTLNKTWNLVPIGKDINNPKSYFSATKIYIMKDSQYAQSDASLKRGQSAWIYKK